MLVIRSAIGTKKTLVYVVLVVIKCKATEENARKALADMRKEAEVVKVTNINDIVKYNVLMTPALVINEKVKVFGRVPNATEIAQWIAEESV